MKLRQTLLRSTVALYFLIALEVLIMISPFAGFFYSAFNPFLLNLAKHSSTRWLSAFYLPHMVLPADGFLVFVRVMGSVLFVAGLATFFVCAAQVYTAKFRRRGAVAAGLYSVIRHPQYLALGLAGLGLSILWPRILTVLLWLVMAWAYYFLAKDEERRMLAAYGDAYRPYMDRTGMFLPGRAERLIAPSSGPAKAALALAFSAAVVGATFALRSYTVNHLTTWTDGRGVTALAILPEDGFKLEHRMPDILGLDDVRDRLQEDRKYLVYFLPPDYVMQGMIADTGGDWRLYKRHHSIAMISDWIFHPFRHLRQGCPMHQGMAHDPHAAEGGVRRRLIFLEIVNARNAAPAELLSINAERSPRFVMDLDIHNLILSDVKDLPAQTGWWDVPTPIF